MFYKMLREAKASIRQNGFTKKKRGVKKMKKVQELFQHYCLVLLLHQQLLQTYSAVELKRDYRENY